MTDSRNDNPGEHGSGDNQADAVLHTRRRWSISPVWLIPLIAVFVGGWLLVQSYASRGPVVQLTMDSAQGIKAGSTMVKVHSVDVGHVTDVALADNYQGAVVHVQMDSGTADLLGADSKFWVVKPRVGPKGISGLNTILSGAYLQLAPAAKPSDTRHFKVMDNPPLVSNDQPGVHIRLTSDGDNALSVGDPIVYLGQNVGTIESSSFSVKKRRMVYQIFVKKPYSKLITASTQFWLRSGIDFHLGSDGIDVQIGSIQSILAGGVTFGLPAGVDAGSKAHDGDKFELYETHNTAVQDRYDKKIKYIVLINDSVRGLSKGAPVEYRGLRVGTVEKAPFYRPDFKLKSFSNIKIPVLIAIEPQRPGLAWADWTDQQWREHNQKFFDHGMRATVKTSNLLTGATFIDIKFDHNAPEYATRQVGKYQVFPSEPSQIANIQQSLSNLMNKLNDLKIKPIAAELNHTVSSARDTLDQLQQVTTRINKLLGQPGTRALPGDLHHTLASLQTTLKSYQRGAPVYQKLNQTLDRLNDVLDETAPLMRTLRNRPNSLIFGRPKNGDPVPRAKP